MTNSNAFFIIAGSQREAQHWMMVSPLAQSLRTRDLLYVTGPETLRGYSNPKGVFYGTWSKRKDLIEILIMLRQASHTRNVVVDSIMEAYLKKNENDSKITYSNV